MFTIIKLYMTTLIFRTHSKFSLMDSDEDCPDLVDFSNQEENTCIQDDASTNKKVPVTIITGHLGSGKTTLLNYVLNEQHNKKVTELDNYMHELENKIQKNIWHCLP